MNDDLWFTLIESKVFSIIKTEFLKKHPDKYPKIYFTTADRKLTAPRFPAVLVTLLPMIEDGQDLEGTTVNAVIATIQIDVTTDTTKDEAQEIMYEIISIMKSMRFGIVAFPECVPDGETWRCVARGQRVIASGDMI